VLAGLTVADATRIAEAMSACHAESTRAIYAGAWQRWERWWTAREIDPMPAHAGRDLRLPRRTCRRRPVDRRPRHRLLRHRLHPPPAPTPRPVVRRGRPRHTPRTAPDRRRRTPPPGPTTRHPRDRRDPRDHRPHQTQGAPATPRSSSATPRRCGVPSWPLSPSTTSTPSPGEWSSR
jgi:hypothetical protein